MAFPIPRASHVLVLVLMVYVTVLNSAIVNILYRTYVLPAIKARDSRQARESMARGFANHPPQTPAAAMPAPESACSSNLAVAVYVGLAAKSANSNDVPHTSLLVRMRSARVPPNTRFFVIMSPESFQPLHRATCQQLPRCEILLASKSTQSAAFRALADAKPCMDSVILVEDTVRIDASFLRRAETADPTRVTCLAAGATPSSCPRLAYRLPRSFFSAHSTRDVDVLPTAHLMGVAGPPVPAVV